MVTDKPLPGLDGGLALARLPQRFAEEEERVGRLRLTGALLQEFAEAVCRRLVGGRRRLILGRLEGAAAEFPSGQRDSGGVGLAIDDRTKRLRGGGPIAVLQLADPEVVAAFEGKRVGGVIGDEGGPLLAGQIPGLAILQRRGRRISRPGGVTRSGSFGSRCDHRCGGMQRKDGGCRH